MKDDVKIEAKHTAESRWRTALRTGMSYAGIGAVFGYVAHLFFGKPGTNPANYVSKDAFRRTATDAAFFGVVGAAIGAIWPNRFGRATQNVEVIVKPETVENSAHSLVANHEMAQSHEAQTGQDSASPLKSHVASVSERRESPAPANQR